jgi:hypothetical protein
MSKIATVIPSTDYLKISIPLETPGMETHGEETHLKV